MKSIIIGILIAAIGAILGSIGYGSYQDWKSSRSQLINFSMLPEKIIVNKDIKNSLNDAVPGDVFAVLNFTNNGNDDIENLDFRVESEWGDMEPIRDMGIIEKVGDGDDPKISISAGVGNVSYKLLRSSEGAKLWVRYRGVHEIKAKTSRKGLSMDAVEHFSAWDSVPSFLMYGGTALIFFILGVAISELGNRHMLRKVGFDPKEIEEMFKSSSK